MLLEMRSICKDYPQGKDVVHILKNISLEIDDGDYLAIMGPSGSGKTTLMNIIGCLDTPTSGTYVPVSYTHLDVYKRQQLQLPHQSGGL